MAGVGQDVQVRVGVDERRRAAPRGGHGVVFPGEDIGAIAIGYDAETEPVMSSARSRPRRAPEEIFHHGRW